MKVEIFGNSIAGSQFSFNSPLGAIQGANGILQLHGNIKFSNNSGVNGGAISLYNAPLFFSDGCAVLFSRNVATGFGGAIYNDAAYHNMITYLLHTACLDNGQRAGRSHRTVGPSRTLLFCGFSLPSVHCPSM